MKKKIVSTILALLLLASTAQAGQWFHVRVEEDSGEIVKVNLPMALARSVMPLIEENSDLKLNAGDIRIGDGRWTVEEFRQVWDEVKAEGNFDFVSIEKGDDDVKVALRDDYLVVEATESSDKRITVRVPAQVVEALLSGGGNELNLSAAIDALVDSGVEELLSIEGKDARVRVWIDGSAAQ